MWTYVQQLFVVVRVVLETRCCGVTLRAAASAAQLAAAGSTRGAIPHHNLNCAHGALRGQRGIFFIIFFFFKNKIY